MTIREIWEGKYFHPSFSGRECAFLERVYGIFFGCSKMLENIVRK